MSGHAASTPAGARQFRRSHFSATLPPSAFRRQPSGGAEVDTDSTSLDSTIILRVEATKDSARSRSRACSRCAMSAARRWTSASASPVIVYLEERKPRTRTYLMCPPEHFAVQYAINPWMDVATPVDVDLALNQWQLLRETLVRLGHTVHVLPARAGLPDLVYAANGAFS